MKHLKLYIIILIILCTALLIWLNPFIWRWVFFNISPKPQNIEMINLNNSQAKDILWGDVYRPKIVIAGSRNYTKEYIMSHNKGYILLVGENSSGYGLGSILPSGAIINLFYFPKSSNANYPIVYEQGQFIIVVVDEQTTENWGARNFEFIVFEKDTKKITNFSLNLPKVGEYNQYTYHEFDDGIDFPYAPRQLAIYNDKFYIAITDLQNKEKGTTGSGKGATVYQYDLTNNKWNKFLSSQHPGLSFTMALNNGFLYWQEQYVCYGGFGCPDNLLLWSLYSKPLYYRIKLQ